MKENISLDTSKETSKNIYGNIAQSLNVAKFTFKCKFDRDCILPKFKGSTFRGVFGRALQRISCGLEDKDCEGCLIKKNCLYAKIFERDDEELKKQGIYSSSPPYIIDTLDNERTRFQKGDYFIFNLILFGEYIFNISYFIYAIIEMGKIGFGKKDRDGKRTSFTLSQVLINQKQVYSEISKEINNGIVKDELIVIDKEFFEKFLNNKTNIINVILETPLRFKQKSFLNNKLSFKTLIIVILRRIDTLFKMYGSEVSLIDTETLLKEAEAVEIIEDNTYWEDRKRYSLRQERSMFLGGLLGEIKYKGDLEIFMPLLEVAKIIHLGKQTSFGLGKIEVIS
ncbi:MAG: CRISPR system precrRNA processing endoribonuclease RAMP protein Cas6 [Bdellovibrionota bacterium]